MYLEYYGLKEKPFSLTPDPAFLYYSKAHRRAVAFLKYGLQESKGFLQLTGPVGSGKTTLLRAILGDLDENTRTAYIINPCAPFPDLLRSIMKDLEIPNIPQTRIKIELLDFFHDYLLLQSRRGNSVIAIFDEAQNLSIKNLEELRMLSNFETTKGKLIQIVFVGQPELIETLNRSDLRQLKQRIQVRYHLSPLSRAEVKGYIDRRLEVAGSNGAIYFNDEARQVIYDYSGGIPRLINAVCDIALLIGYVNETKSFGAGIIEEAIGELDGSFIPEPPEDKVEENKTEPPPGADEKTDLRPNVSVESQPAEKVGPDVPLPVNDDAGGGRPVLSGSEAGKGETESIPRTENSGRDAQTLSVDEDREASFAVIEQEVAVAIADPPEEVQQDTGAPIVIGEDKKTAMMSDDGRKPISDANGKAARAGAPRSPEPQRPDGDLLHSFLRHGGTGRFRTVSASGGAPSDILRHDSGMNWLRGKLRRLVGKYTGKGSGAPTHVVGGKDCAALDLEPPASLRNRIEKTDTLHESESEPKRSCFSPTVPQLSATSWLRCEAGGRRNSQGKAKRIRPTRQRKGRPAGKPAKHAFSVKVAALMADGKIMLGETKDISIRKSGFYLSSPEPRNGSVEELVAFERTVALRFLSDYEYGWEENFSATIHNPKGRQIVVTLQNGEVIEGFTPNRFDPECARFFVISTDDDGEISWALVERAGAAGVLTEKFKEGIYAEEPVSLLDTPETFISASEKICRHESAGDVRFSMGDLDAALKEYATARRKGADKERLDLKISMSRFNRGLEHLKRNRYHKAKAEFLKVSADPPVLERARAKAEMIDRMIGSWNRRNRARPQ